MDVKTGFFYLFSIVLLFAAFRVVTARNPVHAVLYLMLAFSQASAVWLLLEAEFLAIVLVLVYLGAVMVLFLFVVMMLDLNIDNLRQGFWKHFPLAALIGVVAAAAGPLAGPVAIYGASLAVMAVLATGVGRLTGIGGALFLVSDIVLAMELFVAPGAIPYALFVNMALYLPAQLMITVGVLQHVAAQDGSRVADRVA